MRQTTMAAATARPARKPRAQSSRRSWAIILASEAIERVYKPGSKLILFFRVEKLQQLAIYTSFRLWKRMRAARFPSVAQRKSCMMANN
jgi:hypothetical protein